MPNDGDAREQPIVHDEDQVAGEANEPEDGADTPQHEQKSHDSSETETESGEAPAPEASIDGLQEELADLREQLLRKSADFDNYRKRMQREKEEFAAYANRELLLDLVPIIDDFERAIKSGEESQDFTAFHDGIVMIEKQFISMLERKWHLSRFESVGEEFDPQRHEAMLTEEVPGHEQSMVLEDYQKGYLLNDRVLRPAKVKVSMPVPGEGNDADQASGSNE